MKNNDSRNIGLILLGVAVVLLIALGTGCPPFGSSTKFWQGLYSTKYSDQTARHVRVVSGDKLDTSLYPLIDQGLETGFRIAPQYGYKQFLEYPNYTVAMWPWAKKGEYRCENPGFVIRADGQPHYETGNGWDQHPIYDKDRRVGKTVLCAAGAALGNGVMVVAEHSSHMHNIVYHEFEHLMLEKNDVNKWLETMGVHAHPILPDLEGKFGAEKYDSYVMEIPGDVDVGNFSMKKGQKICLLLTK